MEGDAVSIIHSVHSVYILGVQCLRAVYLSGVVVYWGRGGGRELVRVSWCDAQPIFAVQLCTVHVKVPE